MANPIDTISAKVKGAQKGMEARREGLVGVFQTLAKQHGEVAALIERVNNDTSKRDALWPKIKVMLLSHEKAELKAVYPKLARYNELQVYVEQHAQDATQLEQMIGRLDVVAIASDEWMSLFVSLGDAVLAHAGMEEAQIFPIAVQTIGEDRAKELDDDFKSAFKDIEGLLKKTVH
jgi:hemerythrin superfamily protein